MEKAEILEAIRRCAEANGGLAVGRVRFEALTGITESQWLGRHWVKWSDAVAEAGYAAGQMTVAIPDDVVLAALADLVRVLGHYPVAAEFKMRRKTDPSFPHHMVFRRFGNKAQIAARLIEHCGENLTLAEVVAICEPVAAAAKKEADEAEGDDPQPGQVYLMKSGAHYKLGRSNSAGRRAYELAIQLPDRLEVVHVIDTDDAIGIERYWHQRFADRRANGEWFALTAPDIAAFRRRKKFM